MRRKKKFEKADKVFAVIFALDMLVAVSVSDISMVQIIITALLVGYVLMRVPFVMEEERKAKEIRRLAKSLDDKK